MPEIKPLITQALLKILFVINSLKLSASAYILLNKKDSAEILLKNVIEHSYQYGFTQTALQSSTILMNLYVERQDKLEYLKQLIDDYDTKSDLFDEHHELPPTKRQYYYYKGKYFEGLQQLDSAEFYYRKISYENAPYIALDPMYRGLLSIYQKRHQADSIAKYAQLYCEANDSSIALKDRDLTAQMAASYTYNHLQRQLAIDSQKITNATVIISILVVLIVVAIILWVKKRSEILEQQKRKQRELDALKAEYANAKEEYQRNLRTLQILDQSHQIVIDHLKGELSYYQDERQNYKDKYDKTRQEISRVTLQYETEKQSLQEANAALIKRINQYEQKEDLAFHLKNTSEFMNTEIALHILQMMDNPLERLSETDWEQLSSTIGQYFPSMLQDLNNHPKISKQKMKMCLLIIFEIRDSCISNLLGVKSTRLSNMKSEVNNDLFNDPSARTLQNNLRQKYNIILCQ